MRFVQDVWRSLRELCVRINFSILLVTLQFTLPNTQNESVPHLLTKAMSYNEIQALDRSHREGRNGKGLSRSLPFPREGKTGRQLEENQSPGNQSSLTDACSLRNITLSQNLTQENVAKAMQSEDQLFYRIIKYNHFSTIKQ